LYKIVLHFTQTEQSVLVESDDHPKPKNAVEHKIDIEKLIISDLRLGSRCMMPLMSIIAQSSTSPITNPSTYIESPYEI